MADYGGSDGLYRSNVPAEARIYLESLAGKLVEPLAGKQHDITNKDFTSAELNTMRSVVDATYQRKLEQFKDPEFRREEAARYKEEIKAESDPNKRKVWETRLRQIQDAEKGKFPTDFSVDYQDLKQAGISENVQSLANTLGRFRFKIDDAGNVDIYDNYDFDNPGREHRVAEYKKLKPLARLDAALQDTSYNVGALGEAFLGSKEEGRKVNIKLSKDRSDPGNLDTQERPPWGVDWNPVGNRVMGAMNEAAETITTAVKAILPWDSDWGAKRPVEAPRAIQAEPQAFDFNTVFNKLVGAESRGKHRTASGSLTTSPAGAQGITQVMPRTGANPGFGVTPIQNNSEGEFLRFGRDYLRAMLNEFGGDYEKAVAAYNAGHGSVKKAITQATKKGGDWKDYLPKKSETLPYLKSILGGK